jgi:hypothetical protein
MDILDENQQQDSPHLSTRNRINWTKCFYWLEIWILEAMKCNICTKHFPSHSNYFVAGCRTYKNSALDAHAKSELHKKAASKERDSILNKMSVQDNIIVPIIYDEFEQKFFHIFNNLLFIQLENIAVYKAYSLHLAAARNEGITFKKITWIEMLHQILLNVSQNY